MNINILVIIITYMDIHDITQIRNTIEMLDKDKHIEIFKIFKRHNVFFSENKNGIFINLTEVQSSAIIEIQKFIDYINKQEHHIEVVEQQKEEIQKIMALS